MRVILVGLGIGGSALALALQKLGIDYLALEQAPALGEVGAGLQLSPNAVRVLEYLDLGDRLKSFCVEPGAHVFADGITGEVLLQTPLKPKVEAFFGAPYYHAHRADLLAALTEPIDRDHIRLGAQVTGIEHDPAGVAVTLADGRREAGDVLIGADGIHSLVREQVFRPDPPRETGCVAWRGLIPVSFAKELGLARNSHVFVGPHRSVVMYYVRAGDLFNWVGIGPYNSNARESWSQRGSNDAALAEYTGWSEMILKLIAGTESLFMTSLQDREPLETWVDGRVALMGDAAHAMMPFHAQGAGQSIEDAWVLARCLRDGEADIPAALLKYEDLRRDRANLVQHQSRGAEHMFHMSDQEEIAHRNARFAKLQSTAQDGFPSGQRWLYAYDAEKAVTGEDYEWRALKW